MATKTKKKERECRRKEESGEMQVEHIHISEESEEAREERFADIRR